MSNKRAPLVYRTSNPNVQATSADLGLLKSMCKSLSLTVDVTESQSLLKRVVLYLLSNSSHDNILEPVIRLIGGRIGQLNKDDDLSSLVQQLVQKVDIGSSSNGRLQLIRWMARHRSSAINWSPNSIDLIDLQVLELRAWDSMKGCADQCVQIAKTLRDSGVDEYSSDEKCHLAVSIVHALGRARAGLIEWDSSWNMLKERSSVNEKCCRIYWSLTYGLWVCAELSRDKILEQLRQDMENVGIARLDLLIIIESILRLEKAHCISPAIKGDHLTLVTVVPLCNSGGESISRIIDSLQNATIGWTRHSLALISFLLAHRSDLSSAQKIALASNVLHCMHWQSEKHNQQSLYAEGLVSLLYAEDPLRLLQSLSGESKFYVYPSMRLYLILETVKIVAQEFLNIGYIAGVSWSLHKALGLLGRWVESGSQPVPPDRCSIFDRYSHIFKNILREVHAFSPTRIFDPALDYSLFEGNSLLPPAEDRFASPLSADATLHQLRSVVKLQHKLIHDSGTEPIERIRRVLDMKEGDISPGIDGSLKQRICFIIDAVGSTLIVSVREGAFTVFEEIICHRFDPSVYMGLYRRLNGILEENKRCMERKSVESFWEDRKRMDSQMGLFIRDMELALFRDATEESANFLRQFCMHSGAAEIHLKIPNELVGLPIEAMSCFGDKPVVRSIKVQDRCSIPTTAGRRFFVLNPGGDLSSHSESVVKAALKGWSGHAGSPTLSDSELLKELRNSDVFLFAGHGGGEKHWSGNSIQRLDSAPSLVLLMGCSSAKPYGDYRRPFCTPFHYLVGGCGCVVGTLWDVLGKELDRVTISLLEKEGVDAKNISIKLHQAKLKAVKLKHLSAASFVVYKAE